MRFADLHIHTTFSDSTFPPKEVLRFARDNNLAAIAITDHDTIKGIPPTLKEALDIEVIPGIELTAEIDNLEVHILGYLIRWHEDWFLEKLEEIGQVRIQRIYGMVDKLKKIGINVEAKRVFDIAGYGTVGRLHLARAMVEDSCVSSIQEAFKRFIGEGCPGYVGRFRLSPEEAIQMILGLGGVPSLAHPHTLGGNQVKLISQLVSGGLKALEVHYPEYTMEETNYYKQLAERFNLLITGGSDCHGRAKGEILIGKVKVPYELVESLKVTAGR